MRWARKGFGNVSEGVDHSCKINAYRCFFLLRVIGSARRAVRRRRPSVSSSLHATRRPAAAAGMPKLEVSTRLSAIGPTATESVNSADEGFRLRPTENLHKICRPRSGVLEQLKLNPMLPLWQVQHRRSFLVLYLSLHLRLPVPDPKSTGAPASPPPVPATCLLPPAPESLKLERQVKFDNTVVWEGKGRKRVGVLKAGPCRVGLGPGLDLQSFSQSSKLSSKIQTGF